MLIGLGIAVLILIATTTDCSAQGVSGYIGNINVGFDNQ